MCVPGMVRECECGVRDCGLCLLCVSVCPLFVFSFFYSCSCCMMLLFLCVFRVCQSPKQGLRYAIEKERVFKLFETLW